MIRIIVDSAANLPAETAEKYKIQVVPFINLVDGKEIPGFEPGLTPEEEREKGHAFYTSISEGAEVKTSLVNAGTFTEVFEEVLKAGEDIVYISLSSNISGTFSAARIAASDLSESYPERTIALVDSMNASLAQGILAIYARQMIEQGMGAEEIGQILNNAALNMNGVFTVENLKYLAKSGRILNTVALAGNLMSVKPILKGSKDGFIVQAKKVRGRKKSIDELVNAIVNNLVEPEKQILGIAHADAYEESLEIMERVQKVVKVKDFINTSYDFCTGSHVGPGALAVFFLAHDRELEGRKSGMPVPEIFRYL